MDITKISAGESCEALKAFIAGNRTRETQWCDWDIPLHWGGMSDPFQPIERKFRRSLDALKVFAETKYPVVISTKGTPLLTDPEYLELLSQCNAVVQISMVSSRYDKLEPGAPTYSRRLSDAAIISKHAKRLIIRIQPYMRETRNDIIRDIEKFAMAGVYGITIEGIKYFAKKSGLVKCGADFVYPKEILRRDFSEIKKRCDECGIVFYSAENRLRSMGKSLCCCGIDGLDGFKPSKSNLVHFIADGKIEYTQAMAANNATCFKAISQDSISVDFFNRRTYAEVMDIISQDKSILRNLK